MYKSNEQTFQINSNFFENNYMLNKKDLRMKKQVNLNYNIEKLKQWFVFFLDLKL